MSNWPTDNPDKWRGRSPMGIGFYRQYYNVPLEVAVTERLEAFKRAGWIVLHADFTERDAVWAWLIWPEAGGWPQDADASTNQ